MLEVLEVDEMQNYANQEARYGYGDSSQAINNAALNGYEVAGAELLQARHNKMFSNARIGARGVTWSDDFAQFHSSNFAGMNAASVVSTGGWRSPGKYFSPISGDDGHAVSSFNVFDQIPSNRVFLDGVRNGYALIEHSDLGFVDHQVDDAAKAGRPDEGHNAARKTAGEPILNIQSDYQSQNYASAYRAGFGSEDFGVTHSSILSYQEEEGGFGV